MPAQIDARTHHQFPGSPSSVPRKVSMRASSMLHPRRRVAKSYPRDSRIPHNATSVLETTTTKTVKGVHLLAAPLALHRGTGRSSLCARPKQPTGGRHRSTGRSSLCATETAYGRSTARPRQSLCRCGAGSLGLSPDGTGSNNYYAVCSDRLLRSSAHLVSLSRLPLSSADRGRSSGLPSLQHSFASGTSCFYSCWFSFFIQLLFIFWVLLKLLNVASCSNKT